MESIDFINDDLYKSILKTKNLPIFNDHRVRRQTIRDAIDQLNGNTFREIINPNFLSIAQRMPLRMEKTFINENNP